MAASPLEPAGDLPGPPVLGFVACGSVVRRRAFLQVGGFHPVIFFAGEETVLALDLAAAGWGLAYVDEVTAHHQPEAGRRAQRPRRLQARNALLSSWLRRPAAGCAAGHGPGRSAARRAGASAAPCSTPYGGCRRPWRDRRPVPGHLEAQLRLLEDRRG